MPFGVVSGVGQEMDVLDEGSHPQGNGRFQNFLPPIGLNGVFECIFKKLFDLCMKS